MIGNATMQGISTILTATMNGMLEKLTEIINLTSIDTISLIIVISLGIHILSLKID